MSYNYTSLEKGTIVFGDSLDKTLGNKWITIVAALPLGLRFLYETKVECFSTEKLEKMRPSLFRQRPEDNGLPISCTRKRRRINCDLVEYKTDDRVATIYYFDPVEPMTSKTLVLNLTDEAPPEVLQLFYNAAYIIDNHHIPQPEVPNPDHFYRLKLRL